MVLERSRLEVKKFILDRLFYVFQAFKVLS